VEDENERHTIQRKQRTIVLFMAVGTALASVRSFDDFVILSLVDFFLFAIATYLKDKMLQQSAKKLQETTETGRHPFIFLGEEIKGESMPGKNAALTPDERYIILAIPNIQLQRIIFSLSLSAAHIFFVQRLAQKNPAMASLNVIGSGMLCLATLWIFFRVWRKGQFQLVMFANWCGVALLTKAPMSVAIMAIPIYLVLSFHLLQEEREKSAPALWATSWSYCLKVCAVWWLCLLLMGSIVPNQLFQSITKQFHKMNALFVQRRTSPPLSSLSSQQAKQSLEQLSQALAKQMAEASSSNINAQMQRLSELQSQAQDLAKLIDQKAVSPAQLSQRLQEISQELERAQNSSESSGETIEVQNRELQADLQRLSQELSQDLGQGSGRESKQSSDATPPSKNVPEEKKAQQNWERYKNFLFKVAIFLFILLLAKLFEKKAKSQDKDSSLHVSTENFKKRWKTLLARKLDPRTFIIETYQLLAEANHASLVTDKPFCPPYIIYPDFPPGLYQKEWPNVANTFLKTFYSEKAINRSELKLFANSADRLFSVYFTKSLDQAITSSDEDS